MIPRECKRIAEVDFPIAEVSKHAAKEKSINHGHPSTLHLWWARRPLASCRAILMGLLLPDPCDLHCPNRFKEDARRILLNKAMRPAGWAKTIESDEGLRKIILEFIADFANWDNAADPVYVGVSRSLVKAAHGDESPLVVDPFAGGGSIPLEALRLGCEAFASDLNPVACLILKIILEDIPRCGSALAKDLRNVGKEIKLQSERGLKDLYPVDPDGSTPIAYLWARTVRCEAPNCGAEIPLMRSFWLCKKTKRKRALRYSIERPHGLSPRIEFEVFEPELNKDVPLGTVTRAKATCVCCGTVLPPERVRGQLKIQKGGADVIFDDEGKRSGGARLTAIVTLQPRQKGRHYRIPNDMDYAAVRKSQERLHEVLSEWEGGGKRGLCPVPDEPLPPIGTLGFRVQRYGMLQWGDLFTARQKVALVELGRFSSEQPNHKGNKVLEAMLSVCIDRVAMQNNTGCRWKATGESLVDSFGRHAIPIVWDFAESIPIGGSTGDFHKQTKWLVKIVDDFSVKDRAMVQTVDAGDHPLPDQSAELWFTDPPYYNAIPYSDLSDFFLVWLKRTLPNHYSLQDPFDPANLLSPKNREIVQDETKRENNRKKDRDWFEEKMAKAFSEGRRVLREDGVGSVVFAHKTTEGWEALLSGMIRSGWTITGSWPIATEMPSRLRARESAALATSVHLICRSRRQDALIGDWADVLRELPQRVSSWMSRLQHEGIRGADLVFACIGPALEIFSRYHIVETVEGREVELPEYLEKVWEVVGRTALEQVLSTSITGGGLTGILEEDARLTALFLWALQTTDASNNDSDVKDEEELRKISLKGFTLSFDVVRRFAQPMGIDLNAWTGRIITLEKGVVRLLPVMERNRDLFGKDGVGTTVEWIESESKGKNLPSLFSEFDIDPSVGKHHSRNSIIEDELEFQSGTATVLDRVHAAMLLQTSGHANALRTLIESELSRGPEFLQLSNALSALYPRGSQEKRLIDAMLLAVPR